MVTPNIRLRRAQREHGRSVGPSELRISRCCDSRTDEALWIPHGESLQKFKATAAAAADDLIVNSKTELEHLTRLAMETLDEEKKKDDYQKIDEQLGECTRHRGDEHLGMIANTPRRRRWRSQLMSCST